MQYDEWLSNLLKKDSYHIIDPSKINKNDLKGNNLFIDAKVNSQDVKTIIKLQELGFRCIDINIQFYKKLSISQFKKENSSIIFADKKDELSIRELSAKAFTTSRFYKDPNIKDSVASKIKQEWVANFFRGIRGNSMIVAKEKNELLGFLLSLKINECETFIDLIAVNPMKRKLGIAKSMINFLFEELENNKEVIKVGTQIDNISAINLYTSMGFKILSSNFIFHLHL